MLYDAAPPAPEQERRPWWGGDRAASMRRLPSDTAALSAEPAGSGQLGISRSERPAAERAGALVDISASSPCLTHVRCRINIMDHGMPDRRRSCAVRSCLMPLYDSQCYPALQDCSARCLGALMD
jgi:hypothetical protein